MPLVRIELPDLAGGESKLVLESTDSNQVIAYVEATTETAEVTQEPEQIAAALKAIQVARGL